MHADISLDEDAVASIEHWVHKELKSQDKLRSGGKYTFFVHIGKESITRQNKTMAVRNKKKRTNAVSKGKIQAPKTLQMHYGEKTQLTGLNLWAMNFTGL